MLTFASSSFINLAYGSKYLDPRELQLAGSFYASSMCLKLAPASLYASFEIYYSLTFPTSASSSF